ncbi:MAG: NUDIX domain-containing protein [Candidatus Nomurabacteria bacterium]|nr:MAG: NUDIX domain-containing protein [Candidatus Nomurabacteria bacterium]
MLKEFVVRCRAVILHEGKLLVVRHVHDTSYVCLPGGHLEFGEDVISCLKREIVEELGIEPEVGQLLYVNTFTVGDIKQPVEFFFAVKNSADYLKIGENERTHAHELEDFEWIAPTDGVRLLPEKFAEDFRAGRIDLDKTKFLMG